MTEEKVYGLQTWRRVIAKNLVKILNGDPPDPPVLCYNANKRRADVLLDIVKRLSVARHLTEIVPLINEFDKEVRGCVSVPHVYPAFHKKGRPTLMFTRSYGDKQAGEIELVIDAARSGILDRIHKCVCNRWFFGRNDQKSCSTKCRHKRYESTEAFKKKHRLRARWYYAMYQSPKAPAKRLTFTQWLMQEKSTARRKHGQA